MYSNVIPMKFFRIILLSLLLSAGYAFSVHAQSADTITADITKEKIKISYAENRLIVKNLPKDTVIDIYSIFGTKVAIIKAKAGDGEYLLNLAKGYYIVKIEETVKKVAIK